MIRLYSEENFCVGKPVQVSAEEVRYFRSVHRSEGLVVLFNRFGQEAQGEWVDLKNGEFLVTHISRVLAPVWPLRVAVGLPEASVMADIVRALSELGVSGVTFFSAQRSQAAKDRLSLSPRLEKIALEAQRQCARPSPLKVSFEKNLQAILERGGRIWFFDEAFEKSAGGEVRSLPPPECLLIGPEGGWTQEERDCVKRAKAVSVHLRAPTLRVGTAVTAAVALALESSFCDKSPLTPD